MERVLEAKHSGKMALLRNRRPVFVIAARQFCHFLTLLPYSTAVEGALDFRLTSNTC